MRFFQKRYLWLLLLGLVFGSASLAFGRDCNGNGREDAQDVGEGTSEDCNQNGVPDECEGVPIHFDAGEDSPPVAGTVRALQSADLDGDGSVDVVTGSRDNVGVSSIAVLLNNGEGRLADAVEYDAGEDLYAVTVGDLDGDGDRDIVTANQDVLLFFFNKGDATFDPPESFAFSTDVRFAAIGDVTGDGPADIIVTNRLTTWITVLTNSGSGTFSRGEDLTVGDYPLWIATGDFDVDGNLDLATVNRRDLNISVLLNQGGGTFSPAVNYPVNGSTLTLLESGDLNGDGAADLIVPSRTSLCIFMNDGNGSFGEAVTLESTSQLSLALSDYDGDGDLDLAMKSPFDADTAFGGGVKVRANDGQGGFGVSYDFVLDRAPNYLAVADFDGDGDPDLAADVANSVVQLFNVEGGGTASLTLRTQTFSPLTGCQSEQFGCNPHSGAVADFNGDGYLDVVGCNTHPGSFSVLLNTGDGNMEVQPPYTFGGEHPQHSAAADMDADGDPDMLTIDNFDHRLWFHENRGDATFLPPQKFPVGKAPINVHAADFDLDGHLDAATANEGAGTVSFLFNDGDGTLRARRQRDYRVGSAPRSTTAADLDGDGDNDLAVANSRSAEVSVLMNNGDATFADAVYYPLLGNPHYIAHGDLNGDGSIDLATANKSSSNVSVLLNLGDGTFSEAVDYDLGRAPYSIVVVDFDADGLLDLITGNEVTGSISFLLGNGDGTFKASTHVEVGLGLRFVLPGDLDLDGDIDLVTTNRGTRSFTAIYNESDVAVVDFRERICTAVDFQQLSAKATGGAAQLFVKWIMPARDDPSLLPTMFQNSKRFALHQDFLREQFPDRFPVLSPDVYDSLVGRRATRQYYVGSISRVRTRDGTFYGFRFVADFEDAAERPSVQEVGEIYNQLRESFSLEPLVYWPDRRTRAIVEDLEEWQQPGFPVIYDSGVPANLTFVPYTKGVGFGRVRLMTLEEFELANSNGELSFQDILVIDQAPRDIQGVVSGIITGEPQGELSHVSVRTARRGTPNAYLSQALDVFEQYEGELVRLEITETQHRVSLATQAQAETWWVTNRPNLSELPSLDPDYKEFPSLDEIAAMDLEAAPDGLPMEARFGGKATNLARLQRILEGPRSQYREKGFAIPVHYYLEFMRTNSIPSAVEPGHLVTYEEYLGELFADEEFQSNSRLRFEALATLRGHIKDDGQVDPELIESLVTRIGEIFGTPTTTRVRFRSSSNVEDAIEFNGAGLYDSTSGCAADDLDGDDVGPSHCDPTRDNERTIARALKEVWASLWNFGAYEERAYYGIPQELAAMGVLVNRTFIDEEANGVAFTGNPTNAFDRRYVITVQPGEESVVSPEPGILAEKDILEIVDGEVIGIVRATPSSLVPEGSFVLTDQELNELGALLWYIDQNFPVDLGSHQRREAVLDLEFKKVAGSGDLAVKQVRPFLLPDAGPPPPTFFLEIPTATTTCGRFAIGRTPRDEYELKSRLHFVEGKLELPTGIGAFSADLLWNIEVGPERQVATPLSPGVFRVERKLLQNDRINYRFEYTQSFLLPGELPFEVQLSQLDFTTEDGVSLEDTLVFDDPFLIDQVFLNGKLEDGDRLDTIFYASCHYDSLPLWDLRVDLEDGTSVYLQERYRPEADADFGPASLTRAEVFVGGTFQIVTDYFDLIYSAARHNTFVQYWVVLDPPVTVSGIGKPVYVVELSAPDEIQGLEAGANYLGENFELLANVEVVSFQKEGFAEDPAAEFRRGDVNGDATNGVSDATSLLRHLFADAPVACRKAADTNDDGKVNLSDAIRILLYLFRGEASFPEPFLFCGADPTSDGLSCESVSSCP